MDRSKLIVIFGIVIILVFSFWLLMKIIGGDDAREAAFREGLAAQSTIIEVSRIARDESGDSETQELAASIISTTSSDLSNLSEHYSSQYGSPPEAYSEPVEKLENTREGVGQTYRDTVSDYLEFSIERLKFIRHNGNGSDLSVAIETAISNHESHLKKINPKADTN